VPPPCAPTRIHGVLPQDAKISPQDTEPAKARSFWGLGRKASSTTAGAMTGASASVVGEPAMKRQGDTEDVDVGGRLPPLPRSPMRTVAAAATSSRPPDDVQPILAFSPSSSPARSTPKNAPLKWFGIANLFSPKKILEGRTGDNGSNDPASLPPL